MSRKYLKMTNMKRRSMFVFVCQYVLYVQHNLYTLCIYYTCVYVYTTIHVYMCFAHKYSVYMYIYAIQIYAEIFPFYNTRILSIFIYINEFYFLFNVFLVALSNVNPDMGLIISLSSASYQFGQTYRRSK